MFVCLFVRGTRVKLTMGLSQTFDVRATLEILRKTVTQRAGNVDHVQLMKGPKFFWEVRISVSGSAKFGFGWEKLKRHHVLVHVAMFGV